MVAVAYCLWAIIGGNPRTVVNATVALLISVPLYPFFIRSMEEAAQRKLAQRSADGASASTSSATIAGATR
jgi:arginine:agmatine antiporter